MTRRAFNPHGYQRGIIDTIVDSPRCAIWAGMGMGKTVSTLTALDVLSARMGHVAHSNRRCKKQRPGLASRLTQAAKAATPRRSAAFSFVPPVSAARWESREARRFKGSAWVAGTPILSSRHPDWRPGGGRTTTHPEAFMAETTHGSGEPGTTAPAAAYIHLTPNMQAFYAGRGMWADGQPRGVLASMLGERCPWAGQYGAISFWVTPEQIQALRQDMATCTARHALSGHQVGQFMRRLRPPVTLRPEPQAAASKLAKTVIPPGVKVQVCPSPAYAKAPPDTKVVRRAGAPAVYTGRISE